MKWVWLLKGYLLTAMPRGIASGWVWHCWWDHRCRSRVSRVERLLLHELLEALEQGSLRLQGVQAHKGWGLGGLEHMVARQC